MAAAPPGGRGQRERGGAGALAGPTACCPGADTEGRGWRLHASRQLEALRVSWGLPSFQSI